MSLGTILTHCENYARCATPLYVGECRPDCLKRESAKILGHKERRCGMIDEKCPCDDCPHTDICDSWEARFCCTLRRWIEATLKESEKE